MIVMDPVRIAAMTAVMTAVTTAVRIAVRTVAMVLGPAVALEDLVEVEVEAVEARKNSAWTRRPSLLWVRLPLKVSSSTFQFPGPSHDCDLFQVKEIPNYYFFIQSE